MNYLTRRLHHKHPRRSLIVARQCLSVLLLLQFDLNTAAAQHADAMEPLTFVVGNEVWMPGWTFYDSRDWFALTCRARECRLVPATLKVTPSSWRGHYDDRATSGQTLKFEKPGDAPGEAVAWIHRNTVQPWISAQRMDTYYVHGQTDVAQVDKNTFEIIVRTADNMPRYLAPVLIPRTGEADDSSPRDDRGHIFLQLKAGEEQQLFSEPLAACTGELQLDYLLWSGDLDRDGKPDYLIDYRDRAIGTVKFYLSGFAADEELVGLAGTAITDPLDGECD